MLYEHLEPERRNSKIANDIYDMVAGLSVGDFRRIMIDLQTRVNYRSIIPPHEREPGNLFEHRNN